VVQLTAATMFRAGDFARVECVRGGGERIHIYDGYLHVWVCTHCGGEATPKTVDVMRLQEAEPQPQPPVLPVRVKVTLRDGTSVPFDLGPQGGTLVFHPDGLASPASTWGADELASIEVVWPKGAKR